MGKQIRIDTPTRRARLEVRREPYWAKLQARGYLGYRRIADGGTWIARWRDEKGKHHYRALNISPSSAQQAFDEGAKAARAWFNETLSGVVGRQTVNDAAARYVAYLWLRKGESAVRDAQGRINRHIVPVFAYKPLDRLCTADVEQWLYSLIPADLDEEASRKAKDSANRNLSTFKALLNYAWRTELIGSNGAWSRVKAFERVGQARKVFLKPAQRTRLMESCKGAFRNLIEAAMVTGARYGELRALRVADFDRAQRMLSIQQGKTGPRDVPLSTVAHTFFSRLAKSKLPTAFLLMRDDGEPWRHSDQDELMREAVRKAKLPKGTVFYTLRHTFIASALMGGMDIHAVAQMCGTSLRMIELHYGKLIHTDVREKLNKIVFI
jgi:integrase